nr:hypothetical protein [uncultured bacterium]
MQSFRQLMERISVFLHYLFSCVHLGFKILLVRSQSQTLRGINQEKQIALIRMKLRKCFFWQYNSHRVADGGHFHFDHGGHPGKVITYVITQCRCA